MLFDLYRDEAAAVLQSWIGLRKDAVVEATQDCVAQGIDPQARVAKTEAIFMQRFLDHTKAARKQMGVSQSVPMEPDQTQATSMASPEAVDADKVSVPQDSSLGSQYFAQWEADRNALSSRVAALYEAGILDSGAFKQFLQKTPLPDRENSENLSQARFHVEKLAFNAKLQSWVDSKTPVVSQSDRNPTWKTPSVFRYLSQAQRAQVRRQRQKCHLRRSIYLKILTVLGPL